MASEHWYIGPLPEDKHRAQRKPFPVDVAGVLEQAKARSTESA